MNSWPFIVASYGITLAGTAGLTIWSFVAMRRAEADAESLKK